MSSTNRGATRAQNDAYYTPDEVARACVATLATDFRGARVWEPHAGGGAFVRALAEVGALVHFSDVDPSAPCYEVPMAQLGSGAIARDALDGWPFTLRDAPEWIVGNPPFTDAEAHVRMAIREASVGVGLLLRLAFLESAKRRPFWREHPAAEVYVLSQRPSFTGGGTDSAAYAWFVWRRAHRGPTVLRHLDWAEVVGG